MDKKFTLLIIFSALSLLISTMPQADSDRHEREEDHERSSYSSKIDPLYQTECGECHIAYPAYLHTKESWRKVMAGLDDHFGDNAELDVNTVAQITKYLIQNASSSYFWNRSNPLRLTETRMFQAEHDEVPRGAVGSNKQVKSYANCNDCHQRADQGSYREREIRIPGYLTWDD